jgi:hypothetical protein
MAAIKKRQLLNVMRLWLCFSRPANVSGGKTRILRPLRKNLCHSALRVLSSLSLFRRLCEKGFIV